MAGSGVISHGPGSSSHTQQHQRPSAYSVADADSTSWYTRSTVRRVCSLISQHLGPPPTPPPTGNCHVVGLTVDRRVWRCEHLIAPPRAPLTRVAPLSIHTTQLQLVKLISKSTSQSHITSHVIVLVVIFEYYLPKFAFVVCNIVQSHHWQSRW